MMNGSGSVSESWGACRDHLPDRDLQWVLLLKDLFSSCVNVCISECESMDISSGAQSSEMPNPLDQGLWKVVNSLP